MSRRQGRPQGRPAGTEAKRRPLTTAGNQGPHNRTRPPVRAGLQAKRAARSAAHLSQFGARVLCADPSRGNALSERLEIVTGRPPWKGPQYRLVQSLSKATRA